EKWLFANRLSKYALKPAQRVILLSQSSFNATHRIHSWIPLPQLVTGFHPVYDIYRQKMDPGDGVATGQETDRPPTLLFFGLIKPYKGLDVLIRAFALARQRLPRLHLIIAGDVYGEAGQYRRRLSELGLDQAVETHFEYIADNAVSGYFRRADVCVLPYRSATQSGIVQLSYAFEVPVIATRVGGIGEYVCEGETGMLVPPEDPSALAEAICLFFTTCDKDQMRRGIRGFNAGHGWDKLAKLVVESMG
ncbi:MAG: glycosyltransferase family 4 protein, partial [Candidatus Cloacimonetes bacterium]|nr:glycosyltransferase family 4 protein [Candidatus Cloacimonadota bacterium]